MSNIIEKFFLFFKKELEDLQVVAQKVIFPLKTIYSRSLLIIKIKLNELQITYQKVTLPLRVRFSKFRIKRKEIFRKNFKKRTLKPYRDIRSIIFRFLLGKRLRQAIEEKDFDMIINIYKKTVSFLRAKYKNVLKFRK